MEPAMLRSCHVHKYVALGNDYLVLDPAANPPALTSERICALCDRQRGVGADGVVVGPTVDASGQLSVRIFNPDGSEAETSGNGIRIFARYAFEAGYVSRKPFTLATRGGLVTVRILDKEAALIAVDMGKPSFHSRDLLMSGPDREVVEEPLSIGDKQLRVTCVSMGNPHCVVFTDEMSADHARRLGPLLEHAPCFPQRTNVQFARALDDHTLSIQIWERGAGYTLASGSSSCAAASAARRLGLVGDQVEVQMPGGSLQVEFRPADGHALLTGPVTGVMHGFLHADLRG